MTGTIPEGIPMEMAAAGINCHVSISKKDTLARIDKGVLF
jgi:hypothetical protein